MEPVPQTIIKRLELAEAAEQEANAWRNLVPPEPWKTAILGNPKKFAGFVSSRLQAGARNAPAEVTYATKPKQGYRPVPIIGPVERVAYRAIVNLILKDVPKPSRSAQDYRNFIFGPIGAAFDIKVEDGKVVTISDSSIGYVVEADIAAFYQYIDHRLLRDELELQTARIAESAVLVEVLGEIQGSLFGLPQLIDSSDDLSEVYVRMIERDLIRRGLRVWRYNDDFRVGVRTYADAQNAVERLSASARSVGLVLSEHKTAILKFFTYFLRYANSPVDDEHAQIDPATLDADAGEYPARDDDERLEDAKILLGQIALSVKDPDRIDLKNLSSENLRDLRRSISTLTKNVDEFGLQYIVRLSLFAPSLTPRLCEYLIALATPEPARVAQIWDDLTARHSRTFNDWQRAWLAYVVREAELLDKSGWEARVAWLSAQWRTGQDALLSAESALSLSYVGAIEFDSLDVALRKQPEALSSWYVMAMKELVSRGYDGTDRLNAVKNTSPFYRLLIDA